MSSYFVTAPNGRRFKITAPDNATQDDVLAYAQQQFAQPTKDDLRAANPAEYDPSSPEYQERYGAASGGTLENLAAGAGKFLGDLYLGGKQRLGLASEADVAERRRLDAPLMGTTAGKVGYVAGGIGATVPALAIPGVNTVAGAGALGAVTGALQPTVEGESALVNTALGAGLGAGGQKLAQGVGSLAQRKIAERTAAKAAEKAANAVRDANLDDALKAGYVVPPSHANPTVGNRALESVSGKAATQQSAMFKNQKVTNRLIREDLGLSPNAPLTTKTLRNVRTLAGAAYKEVKAVGDIATDGQYLNELSGLANSADDIAQSFPDLNIAGSEEIQQLQSALLQDKFSANAAVELVKKLRAEASSNLSWNVTDPAKKALGMAQREAAGIVEDQVVRHLNAIGKADLAGKFDKARTLIAKTHSVEKAINEGTGNVVATRLVAELRKGKPLTGGIGKAARFAAAFPKAAGEQLSSPGVSALDAMVGGVGGLTVNPSLAALPAGRMAARSTVLSAPYQRAFASPSYVPRTAALRGLGAGAPLLPAAGIVLPGYLRQQEALQFPFGEEVLDGPAY